MAEHTIPYKAGWAWAMNKMFEHQTNTEQAKSAIRIAVAGLPDLWEEREFGKGALAACDHYKGD